MKIKLGLMLLMTALNFGSTVYAEDSDEQLLSKGMWRDSVTGLVWMRCSLGQKWDNDTCVGDAKRISWVDAMFEADKMSYAGYDDWYLPNISDLRSLRQCNTGYQRDRYCIGSGFIIPAIDQHIFPNTPVDRVTEKTLPSLFWSSSCDVPKYDCIPYEVDFGRDYPSQSDGTAYSPAFTRFIRLVRSGKSYDGFSKNLLIAKDMRRRFDEGVARIKNSEEEKRNAEAEYFKKTADFRKSVKEGDDSTVGVVILVKGGLVKIQTNESQCSQRNYNGDCTNYINTPAEKWFKRSEIYPLR